MPRSSRPTSLAAAILAIAFLAGSAAGSVRPGELLVYYGWPSSINATFTVPGAAGELGAHDVVVLGDLIEKDTHPDHANTVAILAEPAMDATTVYGYIDLGVSTQDLPLSEIAIRIDEWAATGADGIFFDDYGYDFGVTRDRQNAAVALAHAAGMGVIANAWVPAHALGSDVDAVANPTGAAPLLDDRDAYLHESYQVAVGAFVDPAAWRAKADAVAAYRAELGVAVFAVTTSDPTDAFDAAAFDLAWYSSLLDGIDAFGWGQHLFSADDAQAPYHPRPDPDPGTAFTTDVLDDHPRYRRLTDLGLVEVDTDTRTGSFTPDILGVAGAAIPVFPLRAFPSPTRGPVSIEDLAGGTSRVVVLDVTGRRVRTLDLAGAHTTWDGRDATGSPVAAGVYFVRPVGSAGAPAVRVVRR